MFVAILVQQLVLTSHHTIKASFNKVLQIKEYIIVIKDFLKPKLQCKYLGKAFLSHLWDPIRWSNGKVRFLDAIAPTPVGESVSEWVGNVFRFWR